ncbi:hypothetical protein SISNIDRAFT_390484, partial [Sistotremastrum niveocremeum HHB9708]
IPANLPPAPQVFFGRSEIVESIVQQLSTTGQSHVAILGPPGIGKTSVALAVLHHHDVLSSFRDNRHYISCEALSTADSLVVFLGHYLGIEGKASQSQIVAVFRRRPRSLIVFDNFETPWESAQERCKAEELLSRLADVPELSLLLTLRGAERPSGIAWKRPCLPPLAAIDYEAAKKTFVAVSDTAEDDIFLPKLLEELDYVPLAVTLMANMCQHTSCEALLAQWQEDKTKMLTRGFDSRLSSVEISIEVSISSERLRRTPLAIRILQILSLLPDGVLTSELPTMLYGDGAQLPAAISTLRQVTLIYVEHGSGRLRSLSPIREYIQLHNPLDGAALHHLQLYFFELTKSVDDSGTYRDKEVLNRIQSQLMNIFTVLLNTL